MSLIIQGLRKSYRQGDEKIEVLRDLSARLEPGEVVSVVGRSGSGKSTMLSLLAGLEKADGGRIEIDGTDIAALNERDVTAFRASRISIVFQQYHLVPHLTALENVALPLEILGRPDPEAKARVLLEELGLGARLNHAPSQLSGGESQRVAIARALVTEPKILLADEPSGNLDTETGDKVMDLFFDVIRRHKITTLLVTHSETLARRCPRTLRLDHGVFREG